MLHRCDGVVATPLIAIVLILAGCSGQEHVGNSVVGSVTYRGQALEHGAIEFSPAAGQETMSGAPIVDGQYSLPPTADLQAGTYTVRITATSAAASTNAPPGEPTVAKQTIPPQYDAKSTLTADVKDSGENKFNFDLR
jgi:hypothetical protein